MALKDNLISFYKFEGNVSDAFGINSASVTTNMSFDRSSGHIGEGGYFNGTAFASAPNSTSLQFGTSPTSISIWIRPSIIEMANSIVVDKIDFSAVSGLAFRLGIVTGKLYFFIRDAASNGVTLTAPNKATLNVWSHYVATDDGTTAKLYENNILIASGSSTAVGSISNTGILQFGRYTRSNDAGSSYYNGFMDDIGIWNKALTTAEINSLYNGGIGLTYPFETKKKGGRKVVQDSLIMSIDAGNTRSYSTGSTVNDLKNSHNASISAVTTTTDNGGVLEMTSTGSTLSFGDSNAFTFGNGAGTDSPFSISGWFNPDSFGLGAGPYNSLLLKSSISGSTWTREYTFAINEPTEALGAATVIFNVFSNTPTGTDYISSNYNGNLDLNGWNHITATYNGSKSNTGLNIYLNGQLMTVVRTNVGTYTGMSNTISSLATQQGFSGGSGINPGIFNGQVSSLLLYGKELSATEVLNNYDSTKYRFRTEGINPAAAGKPKLWINPAQQNYMGGIPVLGTAPLNDAGVNNLYHYNDRNCNQANNTTTNRPLYIDGSTETHKKGLLYWNGTTITAGGGFLGGTTSDYGFMHQLGKGYTTYILFKNSVVENTNTSKILFSTTNSSAAVGTMFYINNTTATTRKFGAVTYRGVAGVSAFLIEESTAYTNTVQQPLKLITIKCDNSKAVGQDCAWLYINGQLDNTTTMYGLPSTSSTSTFGAYIGNYSANAARFNGYTGDILIFDGVHDDTTRQQIENYLMQKWKI